MNKQKGFTIIELIVVIAIIAVLASIVLVNVTSYINKGKDAAIKGNMGTILTNAAIYFDDSTKGNGTYTDFNLDNLYIGPAAAITTASAAPEYLGDADRFCVKVVLKDTSSYCVDSTGYKGTLTTDACATDSYTCSTAGTPVP